MKFDAQNASIAALIKRYDIGLKTESKNGKEVLTGAIYALATRKLKSDNAMEIIRARKPEIYNYLVDRRNAEIKAAEERQAKIDAIEGLKELKAARADLASWHKEFEKSFDDVGGLGVRSKPNYDLKAMSEKYPRAAAYIKADAWAYAANFEKASAGRKAKERIINGEEPALVLREMEEEWDEACRSHIWD